MDTQYIYLNFEKLKQSYYLGAEKTRIAFREPNELFKF
jgi:hypothetical protein